MNTQQPNRPAITPAMREQAKKQPNSWLYVVDPIFTDPNAEVPPWGFIGGYRVDERGEITDEFSPNPNYRPSPVALRLPAPTNDAERALQLTTTGYAPGQTLLNALLDAELVLFAQPQGSGLFLLEHESGRRQLQVFTSDNYLPPNWSTWQRMTGRQLAGHNLTGVDLQINPTSPVKARIPGEDLVKAAGANPPKAPAPATPPAADAATKKTPVPALQTNAEAPTVTIPPEAQPKPPQNSNGQPQPPQQQGQNGQPAQPQPAQAQPQEQAPAQPDPAANEFGKRFLGSMLGSAIGDALGAPVEFYPVGQIRSRFGESGVRDYDRNGDHPGEFTDDTQLALFTLEGLIRGHIAVRNQLTDTPLSSIQLAYQRWLHTQGYAWVRAAGPFAERNPEPTGWLINQRELFSVRSPNSSCITALREFAATGKPGTFTHQINDANDCAGVVRAAPVALWSDDPGEVFELAAATAALTFSQPEGYLPAGVLAALVHGLLRGKPLPEALAKARALLARYPRHETTDQLLQAAVELAQQGTPSAEQLKDRLGGGWAGHEALAIAVCAALSTNTVMDAIMTAVNHSGDSDSTAAICGSIVGAQYGVSALPGVWLRDLKHQEIVEQLARDALLEFGPNPPKTEAWQQRYPVEHDVLELDFKAEQQPANEPTAPEKAPEEPAPQPAQVTEPPQPETAEDTGEETDKRALQIRGLVLGGAVGDALGYPVEEASLEEIRSKHGPAGVTGFSPDDERAGIISDNTQLSLFTLEGLIRAAIRRRLHGEQDPVLQVQYAYQRWLHTQGVSWKDAGGPIAGSPPDGWLVEQRGLFDRRTPSPTNIQALQGFAAGNEPGSFDQPLNVSKGCSGVTRAAGTGLWSDDPSEVFRLGARTAVLTHGHPSGYLPAGALAVIIQQLVSGRSLPEAVDRALTELAGWEGHEETTTSLRRAIELAAAQTPTPEKINEWLGEGWFGEQTLGIAVCAALTHPESFSDAVLLATNHTGDSGSTAAVCGAIMGAARTVNSIPPEWLDKLELHDVIEQLAEDAAREFSETPPDGLEWLRKYPIGVNAPAARAGTAEAPAEPTTSEEPAETDQPAPESAEEAKAATEQPAEAQPPQASAPAAAPAPAEEPAVERETAQPAPAAEPAADDAEQEDSERPAEAEQPAESETADQSTAEPDGQLTDEELRLLAAWRKFRDNSEDSPAKLSEGLYRLLVEAFGEERAAQLLGEVREHPEEKAAVEEAVRVNPEQRLVGCVLGGAVGDALGAPWTFVPLEELQQHNPEGVREYSGAAGFDRGSVTALTQQTAFVLEGLIRANLGGEPTKRTAEVRAALRRWLHSQGVPGGEESASSGVAGAVAHWPQRFPDEASLVSLGQWNGQDAPLPNPENPPNDARSPHAAVRGAVAGFAARTLQEAVSLGIEIGVLTHGSPDGYLPAGALAGLVWALQQGQSLTNGVQAVLAELDQIEGAEITAAQLRAAVDLAAGGPVDAQAMEKLGPAWSAPEVLAVGVAAALSHPNSAAEAISLAATHSGHSSATAAVCGALIGTARGVEDIPDSWRTELELRELLQQLATDYHRSGGELSADQRQELLHRYGDQRQ